MRSTDRIERRIVCGFVICIALLLGLNAAFPNFSPPANDLADDAPDSAFVVRGKVLLGTADFTGLARYCVADTLKENLDGPGDRSKSSWKSDPSVLPERPIGNADYLHSEMAKGHRSPASDNSQSQTAMDWSHSLLNAGPQNQPMNNGVWKEIEKRRQKMARAGAAVRSTTILIFELQPAGKTKDGCPLSSLTVTAQGKNQLWQPTHFATSVRFTVGDRTWYETYLVPNTADVADDDPKKYLVAIDVVEFDCNLNLWPCPPSLKGAARERWIEEQEARESAPP